MVMDCTYRVELVWNREFHWARFGRPHGSLDAAKAAAISIRDSGDGERVKKVRVLDDVDKTVWTG